MFTRSTVLIFVIVLFASAIASAQSSTIADIDDHKAEIGIVYTGINMEGFGSGTISGVGGRFGYNINKNFAIDAEANLSPETKLGNDQTGQKAQALIGVKAGVRSGRFGIFAKARPGVMFIGETISGFNCSSNSSGTVCRPNHNNLALDLGGVLEVYPSKRTIVRFDAGDTIVRLRQTTGLGGGLFGSGVTTTNTTNNFQFSVGFGYRF